MEGSADGGVTDIVITQLTPGGKRGLYDRRSWRRRLFSGFIFLVLMFILIVPVRVPAADLTCSRLPMLMESFLIKHYAIKSMSGEIKTQTVDQMIKSLDPSKTLLYQSDIKKLNSVLQNVLSGMQEGNCTALKEVHTLLISRSRENEAMIKKILGPDYRLDETVELNINVNKRPYVKTPAEKYELLRKLVQFQIENALMAGIDLKEAKKQQIHRYELQTKRLIERNPEKLIISFAESFASALDPHTSYLSPEKLEDLQIQMQLSLEGIGAALSSDNGFVIIEELIPGGSAERSGLLRPKDKIVAVAQEGEKPLSVIDMDLHAVIKMIRGKKGTKVTLTILRQEQQTSRFDVTITRDKIDLKEQEASIAYETRSFDDRQYRFGVISLPSFYGDEKGKKSCYEDVKKILAEVKGQNVDGIVLDLSRNTGGLLREAVRLVGLFVDRGGVVATKDSRGRLIMFGNGTIESGKKGEKRKLISFPMESSRSFYSGPLVILTSRLSASASEIVAGALKDYRRAVIVGSDHTFGKGSVQELMPLPWGLGAMKVTTGLYFLPGGKSTQKVGIEADVRLPGWFILEKIGETELDYSLPVQTIAPFLSEARNAGPRWKPLTQSMLAELSARSNARIAKDERFTEIRKNNKESASKQGIVRLSDLRKDLEKKNGGNKKKETSAELKKKLQDQYAPYISESVNVLCDMVKLSSP